MSELAAEAGGAATPEPRTSIRVALFASASGARGPDINPAAAPVAPPVPAAGPVSAPVSYADRVLQNGSVLLMDMPAPPVPWPWAPVRRRCPLPFRQARASALQPPVPRLVTFGG